MKPVTIWWNKLRSATHFVKVAKARVFAALEALLLFCLTQVVLFPFSPAGQPFPSRDSGVFLYVGWRILHGEFPYLNVWDHKPPAVYYLDALGVALTPSSTWGVWLLEALLLLAAAFLCYGLVKRLFGLFPALLVSFFWLLTLVYILAGGNLTEEYPLAFQFAVLWLFYESEKRGHYGWRGFLIGAASGIIFFTRQTSIGVALAIGIYLVASRLWKRDFRKLLADSAPILFGGLLVTAIIAVYFKMHGALGQMWLDAFRYNFYYSGERNTADRLAALLKGMDFLANAGLAQLSMFGWAASLVILLFKREKLSAPMQAFLWMAVIDLPIEIALVSVGGRPRAPYFIALLPIFAVLAGKTLGMLFDSLAQNGLPRVGGALVTLVMVLTLGAVVYNDYLELSASNPSQQAFSVVRYIDQNTQPSDTVLMWGAETAYNFVARRASPTRFVYQFDLYKYADRNNTTEFVDDILTKKPKLIIITAGPDKLNERRFVYQSAEISAKMAQVRGMYTEVGKVGGWPVYLYNGQ